MLTQPLEFTGSELTVNFSTGAAGSIRIELQQANGMPISGSTLEDCEVSFGAELKPVVFWKRGSDVSALARQPARLRVVLQDADFYAIRLRSPAG